MKMINRLNDKLYLFKSSVQDNKNWYGLLILVWSKTFYFLLEFTSYKCEKELYLVVWFSPVIYIYIYTDSRKQYTGSTSAW